MLHNLWQRLNFFIFLLSILNRNSWASRLTTVYPSSNNSPSLVLSSVDVRAVREHRRERSQPAVTWPERQPRTGQDLLGGGPLNRSWCDGSKDCVRTHKFTLGRGLHDWFMSVKRATEIRTDLPPRHSACALTLFSECIVDTIMDTVNEIKANVFLNGVFLWSLHTRRGLQICKKSQIWHPESWWWCTIDKILSWTFFLIKKKKDYSHNIMTFSCFNVFFFLPRDLDFFQHYNFIFLVIFSFFVYYLISPPYTHTKMFCMFFFFKKNVPT